MGKGEDGKGVVLVPTTCYKTAFMVCLNKSKKVTNNLTENAQLSLQSLKPNLNFCMLSRKTTVNTHTHTHIHTHTPGTVKTNKVETDSAEHHIIYYN